MKTFLLSAGTGLLYCLVFALLSFAVMLLFSKLDSHDSSKQGSYAMFWAFYALPVCSGVGFVLGILSYLKGWWPF